MWKSSRYSNENEKKYYEEREKLITQQSPQTIADSPFLFSSSIQTNEIYARIHIFDLCKDITGHIVECGTFTGNNLMLFANLFNNITPFIVEKKLIGFDTFEGFDNSFINEEKDNSIKTNISNKLFKNEHNSYELLNKSIDLYNLNRPLNHMSKIELVKGDACKTIPQYIEDNPELVISLLYLDFDLYDPTKIALEYLYDRVVKGGIIAFDEFSYDKYPGETQAVIDTIGLNHEFKKIHGVPLISYFIKQ